MNSATNSNNSSSFFERYETFCVRCITGITKRNFVGRDILAMPLITGFAFGLVASSIYSVRPLVHLNEGEASVITFFLVAGGNFIHYFLSTFFVISFCSLLGRSEEALVRHFSFGSFLRGIIAIVTLIIMGIGVYFIFTYSPNLKYSLNDDCQTTDCTDKDLSVSERADNQSLSVLDNNNLQTKSPAVLDETNLQSPKTKDEIDALLKKLNLEYLATDKRTGEMAQTFEGITLFPSEKSDEHWKSFLSELSNVPSNDKTRAMSLVHKALRETAPYYVLIEIINIGYQFDGGDVASMARYLSVTEIKRLENLGVDFTQATPSGLNALVRSMANRDNTDVFDYFLLKDELVYSEEINNVRQVLQLSSLMNAPTHYAKKLIDKGSPITAETKAWIDNELRHRNPDFYKRLKNEVQI